MKPRNFPERKNTRRQRALDRLVHKLSLWNPTREDEKEFFVLQERIVESARNVKTKKCRQVK